VNVHELLTEYPADVLRIFFASAHYRSQMDYTPDTLDGARSVWERFQAFLRVAPPSEVDADDALLATFGEAMDDDLNTPGALAALHELVREGHQAVESGDNDRAGSIRAAVVRGLGILGCEPGAASGSALVGPLVELLLQQRQEARAAKDFARADEIRNKLTEIGVTVEDSAEGPRWFIT
jgi:cysteinyl-tRNA synthetase